MPVSINNTTITFNDATTQTTAGLVSGGALGTPSSGTLTNCTSVPVNQATGTLPVANGGTGATSLTANNVLLGNGTSALQVVAPGSNGNVLTSNGTTWTSAAPAGGGVTSLNGQTGAVTTTNFDSIGGTGILMNATNSNLTYNSTRAGSSLRYNFTCNQGAADSGSPFGRRVNNGDGPYSGGGTAIAGTWKKISTGNVYILDDGQHYWWEALYVRIS
jgi:hypothetical protein